MTRAPYSAHNCLRTKNVVLDCKAQNCLRSFLLKNSLQPALQLQIFNRVQILDAHVQRSKMTADALEVGHGVIGRCQNRYPVTISQERLDQRPSEIPDVPRGVHRHQNVHVVAFVCSGRFKRLILYGCGKGNRRRKPLLPKEPFTCGRLRNLADGNQQCRKSRRPETSSQVCARQCKPKCLALASRSLPGRVCQLMTSATRVPDENS